MIGDEVGLTLDQIVVATDFTPVSEMAVAYAAALAKRFASKLTVASVVESFNCEPIGGSSRDPPSTRCGKTALKTSRMW